MSTSNLLECHNQYVQQLHATNGMIDQYYNDALPDLLQVSVSVSAESFFEHFFIQPISAGKVSDNFFILQLPLHPAQQVLGNLTIIYPHYHPNLSQDPLTPYLKFKKCLAVTIFLQAALT
jgi:hypothetical protein